MVENSRYSQQKFSIYGLTPKYIVYIRTAAVQLTGEPFHSACPGLPVKNLFYKRTDM